MQIIHFLRVFLNVLAGSAVITMIRFQYFHHNLILMTQVTDVSKVLPTGKIIPSHAVGTWLLDLIHRFLDIFGLGHNQVVVEIIYVAIVMCVSLLVGMILKWVIIAALRKLVKVRKSVLGKQILEHKVISKCAKFIPPLVFMGFLPIAFNRGNHLLELLERLTAAYAVVALGIGLSAIGSFIFFRYNSRENTRGLPIKGILNISLGILWIVVVIIAISIIADKSPAYLLTGLGAFAAALMLIFKDSILGFVAGIQMSQNDMLHQGDWIVVPGTPANGTVIDVTLSAVKIQNFDNTIVTVPPYTLVSGSFQNYRGMKEYGARRFTRTFTIDTPTVSRLTPELTASILEKYPEMKPFVQQLHDDGKQVAYGTGIRPLNGTVETNLGLFRAYCCQYLLNSPLLSANSQVLVRILDPTINGIPLDFYAFTDTTDWNSYEAIQSAIMEHFAVAVADFGLSIYTSGSLTIDEAEPGAAPQVAPQGAGATATASKAPDASDASQKAN